jgi:polysaccharide export outer membrane protein
MKFNQFIKSAAFIMIMLLTPIPANAQNFVNVKKDKVLTPEEQAAQQTLINEQVQKSLAEVGVPNVDTSIYTIDELNNSKYTLGINDVIEVTVLRHPEVSGQFNINNEGNIQFEFVGDLHVTGMTKEEVTTMLAEKLTEFIISPEVTVQIVGYNSKVVYVIGEVGSPGKIYMRGDTITIREALLMAGLPLLTAKVEKTKLFTPSAEGIPEQKNVDLKKLLYKGDLRENIVMKPGDTLFVPPTAMTKVMRTIQPVASPITTATGAGRSVYTGGF